MDELCELLLEDMLLILDETELIELLTDERLELMLLREDETELIELLREDWLEPVELVLELTELLEEGVVTGAVVERNDAHSVMEVLPTCSQLMFDSPLRQMSRPFPPPRRSLPVPPSRVSLPLPASRLSFPSCPHRRSPLLLPSNSSSPPSPAI